MSLGQEFRRSHRFPVCVPVMLGEEQGETRDVSVDGVFFYSKALFRAGEEIAFSLQFDKTVASKDSHLFFACSGKVLRCEKNGLRNGVAVRFTDRQHAGIFN